nr:hypothetical protein [Tanacetum cinerariifolium]
MNPNGDRPNRRTRDFRYWKTTQKDSTVCDDASGLEVRKRRCLVYYDASNKKSQWLMHKDTTNDRKLSDWVLAKIYKKDENKKNRMNPKKLMEDQNQLQDEPTPSRRRYQQLAIQPMDTLSGSYLTQPTFQDPPQAIVIEQVQTFDGSSTCEDHHNQSISTSTNDF